MTMTDAPRTERADGRVVAIAGPVIDVEFPPAQLPELNHAVEFDVDVEGRKLTILAEVAQQLGHGRVRAVCMKPTDGLKRGTTVRNLCSVTDPRGKVTSFTYTPGHGIGWPDRIKTINPRRSGTDTLTMYTTHHTQPKAPGGEPEYSCVCLSSTAEGRSDPSEARLGRDREIDHVR